MCSPILAPNMAPKEWAHNAVSTTAAASGVKVAPKSPARDSGSAPSFLFYNFLMVALQIFIFVCSHFAKMCSIFRTNVFRKGVLNKNKTNGGTDCTRNSHPKGPLPLARQRLIGFEHHRACTGGFYPPKWHFFGRFEKPKEAFFELLHTSTLRGHAPHSSGKHIFIKNNEHFKKYIEINVLNDACTKGTASDIRNSYPRTPPMPLIWEKWLRCEWRLHFEGRSMGKIEGDKFKSGTF